MFDLMNLYPLDNVIRFASEIYEPILFKQGMMISTTRLYSLIRAVIMFAFIYGDRGARKL